MSYYKPISYLTNTPVERGEAGLEGRHKEHRVRASVLLDGDATGAKGDLAARTVIWEERRGRGEREERERGERGEERGEREKRADRQKYGRSEEEVWRRIHTQTTHTQYTHSTVQCMPHIRTTIPSTPRESCLHVRGRRKGNGLLLCVSRYGYYPVSAQNHS